MEIDAVVKTVDYDSFVEVKSVKPCCANYNAHMTVTVVDEEPRVCFHYTDHITSYEDEWDDEVTVPIRYCPYCGEKIKFNVAEEDLTTSYNAIESERNYLMEKSRKTDSIKERDQLLDRVRNLDRQANDMLSNGIGVFEGGDE